MTRRLLFTGQIPVNCEKRELHGEQAQELYRAFPSRLQLHIDQHISMNMHAEGRGGSIERIHGKEEVETITRAHRAGNSLCSY